MSREDEDTRLQDIERKEGVGFFPPKAPPPSAPPMQEMSREPGLDECDVACLLSVYSTALLVALNNIHIICLVM